MEIQERILYLKAFLEGLYIGGSLMNQAFDDMGPHFGGDTADLVTVELHNTANYFIVEHTINDVKLSTGGNMVIKGIPSEYSGSYYVTIRHRNSIETTSAIPVSLTGGTINYDFTSAASMAFGDNLRNWNGTGVYTIWGGDVNQDGIVDSGDMNPVDNAATIITFGYIPEDVNGDGIVDSSDMNYIDNNSTAIIMAMVP